MSAVNVSPSNGAPDDGLRESWRQVMSMRRSTQQFRARVSRTLPSVQMAVNADPQFGDAATVMTVLVRVLDWAVHDLDLLRLPEELFEVIA